MSINKGFGRINGAWNQIDGCYIKQNGLWVKHPSVHVKRGGDWYKVTFAQLPPDVICVSPFGDGDGTGSNWSNAMSFANFRATSGATPGKTYFLKKGCYVFETDLPTTGDFENYYYKGTPRCFTGISFFDPAELTVKLPPNTSIYGGFEGNDAEPMKRHGMFAGIENRTVFFRQAGVQGREIKYLFTIQKSNADTSDNFITIDNLDMRVYMDAIGSPTGSVLAVRYISDETHTVADSSGLHITLSRISAQVKFTYNVSAGQVAPESGLPARCSLTVDSCMLHTSFSGFLSYININTKNASFVTKNNIFINRSSDAYNYFSNPLVPVEYQNSVNIYHINDTLIASGLNKYGFTDGNKGDFISRVIPKLVNTIYIHNDKWLADPATPLYRNGNYSTKYGNYDYGARGPAYRDNYLNSITQWVGTTSAGDIGNYNTLGMVCPRPVAELVSSYNKLMAFVTNEELLITVAGYSDAITTPGAYSPGTVLGGNNASVPTVDITGYSRPSGVMTLGAWHYR